jgi:hypothetical protein
MNSFRSAKEFKDSVTVLGSGVYKITVKTNDTFPEDYKGFFSAFMQGSVIDSNGDRVFKEIRYNTITQEKYNDGIRVKLLKVTKKITKHTLVPRQLLCSSKVAQNEVFQLHPVIRPSRSSQEQT